MPGISFLYNSRSPLSEERRSTTFRSLDSLIHGEPYFKKVLLDEEAYVLASTQYREYPFASLETDDYRVYIEGRVYGKQDSQLQGELRTLANSIFESRVGEKENARDWVRNTDGEFVIVLIQKRSNRIAILNDSLGRLPLYYSAEAGEIVVSRELRFIARLKSGRIFDKTSIAQYLLFSYPLGRRTLLKNTYRLDPATMITINGADVNVEVHTPVFNFEVKEQRNNSLESNASALGSLFSESCKNRAHGGGKNVVGLSGGLDSRSVGACLTKNEIPFSAATFDIDQVFAVDAQLAEQLAQAFNVSWRMFHLNPPTGKDFTKLLKMKGGLNYVAMSFILPYFDQIRVIYGPDITYFTGDGGDKLLPDLRPPKQLRSLDDCLDYLLSDNAVFAINRVASLTRLPTGAILDEIRSHISNYPEDSWAQKYVHFLIYERTFKWLYEGEDRNRCYFWSVAPFLSLSFLKYAMGCPDDQKARYALYRQFLLGLSRKASEINNSHWNMPISSKGYMWKLFLRSMIHKIPPEHRRRIKGAIKPYRASTDYVKCFQEQIRSCKALDDYLSRDAVQAVLGHCTKTEMATLMTITSSIEEIETGQSTLEKYQECSLS